MAVNDVGRYRRPIHTRWTLCFHAVLHLRVTHLGSAKKWLTTITQLSRYELDLCNYLAYLQTHEENSLAADLVFVCSHRHTDALDPVDQAMVHLTNLKGPQPQQLIEICIGHR
jgi:hypothetical protein